MSIPARCVVCAYQEVGHAALSELIELGVEIPLVVTHADDPGEERWFGSVADLAVGAGIPVLVPDDPNAPDVVETLTKARPDLLFSFYFRKLLRPPILELPRLGALNLHGSLLPHYRGRAPVNWAILHGESETGVTLHYMDAKPDHGDVVGRRAVAIERDDTALSVTRKLAAAGRVLLREMVPRLAAGTAPREPQDHVAARYFGGRSAADGEIDWAQPAESIRNLVRAVTRPWPGAFGEIAGRRVFVWWAEVRSGSASPGALVVGDDGAPLVGTGEGLLELVEVSGEGGASVSGREWLGARVPDGS